MPNVTVDFDNVTIAFEKLTQEVYDVVDDEVRRFYTDLQTRNPVDTGAMKASWSFAYPNINAQWIWTAINAMDYSDIITQGRRKVGNKWYGSIKGWGPGGVAPMLEKMSNNIIRRTNELKI